ncbi:MAG TPA: HAMP domain-containing sensor histidine kinase [Streptosporangiaceae bacterium]|nr:HAMP domain-containing sensor histidine kinase [Streptosporangiaceae bacterium]
MPADDGPPPAARRPRIRRRLALIAATATGTVLLAFCLPLAIFVRNVAYDRAIDSAELDARALAAELVGIRGAANVSRIVRQASSASTTRVTVYLISGRQVGAPLRGSVRIPPSVLAEHAVTQGTPGGGRLVWEPVHDQLSARAVVAWVPPAVLTSGVVKTWTLLFGGGALLVLIAVGLTDRLGRSIVRPLLDLVTVTHQLRDGDLDSRDEPSGPYEVAEVGQAVNELADRIEGLLASARLAAADLGHRLRTPLTALRLHAEALGDPAAKRQLHNDIDVLEEAVNDLIRQTRDPPPKVVPSADLAEAVRDRMAYWTVLARSQRRPAVVQLPDCRVGVGIGRDELDAAIDALLSNVFIHTPPGTGFRVELRQARGGASAWSLLVENDRPAPAGAGRPEPPAGPAPPASLAPPRGGRAGTGLGLDIVRRTAAGLGGSVRAGVTAAGGFGVHVRLPCEPAGAPPAASGEDEPSGR